MRRAVTGLLISVFSSGALAEPSPRTLSFSCDGAFSQESSLALVQKTFGKRNVRVAAGDCGDPVVLYPNDRSRRVEIEWWGCPKLDGTPGYISTQDSRSHWHVGKIRIGSPISVATAENGQPFYITGFSKDGHAFLDDRRISASQKIFLPCGEQAGFDIIFGFKHRPPERMLYENTLIRSDDPGLLAAGVYVKGFFIRSWRF